MLEDQRCLRSRDIRVGVEVFHDERPQIVGIAGGDMKDEVVGAGQEVDVDHLGQLADLGDEVPNPAAIGRPLQAMISVNLQSNARGRVDIGVEPANHADVDKPAQPAVTRRRRDPDHVREHAVGHPCVVMQGVENAAVDVVNNRGPNILRRARRV